MARTEQSPLLSLLQSRQGNIVAAREIRQNILGGVDPADFVQWLTSETRTIPDSPKDTQH